MRLAHYLIVELNSNHRISNVKFLSALTARDTDTLKVFAFVGPDASNAHAKTTNCSCREKFKDVKCVLCEGNPANYKGCMIYKDLRRNFVSILRNVASGNI